MKEQLDSIEKKVDELSKLMNRVAKALNLLPITKKEADALYKMRVKNSQILTSSLEEAMGATPREEEEELSYNAVFDGIIGDDILGGL